MLSTRSSITLFAFCLSVLSVSGRQRSETELFSAAKATLDAAFQRQANCSQYQAPAVGRQLTMLSSDSATAIIGYPQGAWTVVSTDDLLPEVLGYSLDSFDPLTLNPNVKWWMAAMETACRDLIRRGTQKRSVAPDPTLYEPYMDALVTARWGQEAPYWNMCPTGTTSSTGWGYEDNTSGICVTGCVATGMAQVLYYHKAPINGCGGTHSVSVKQAGGGYQTYTVDYDEAVYDWDNMLDEYRPGHYNTEQADAVAMLMYHCGVATDMMYATDGSGAYMDDCAEGLRRNFGFNNITNPYRNNYSEDQWMDMVYTELNENRPIIYAGDDPNPWLGGGHCFVLDGYDDKGLVHINWGWDGSSDGMYNIALLNPGSYSFSAYQEMVIGVEGDGVRKGVRNDTLVVAEPGTLASLIDSTMSVEANRILVEGEINATDIAALRQLIRGASARVLDLRQAPIQEGELADSALALCSSLTKLVLPRGLSRLGNRALAGCTSLRELRVYDREVPKVGIGAFNDVKTQSCYLYVPAATKDRFKRASSWKNFGTEYDNIIEFGSAFTVRNCTREQGKPNPEFQYMLIGDPVAGEPELHCEADEDSPVGRYPITFSPGTVENQDVDYVDGYLIITEATQGIEAVEVDATAPEVFYDLFGRRLGNDAKTTFKFRAL